LDQRAAIFGTIGDQHQRRRLRNHHEELGQHRLADLIDPVRVFDDVERPGFPGQHGGIDQGGQPPPTRIRINPGKCHLGVRDAQQVIEEHQVLSLGVRSLSPYPRSGGMRVKTVDAGGREQQPRDGMKGDFAQQASMRPVGAAATVDGRTSTAAASARRMAWVSRTRRITMRLRRIRSHPGRLQRPRSGVGDGNGYLSAVWCCRPSSLSAAG
jgi:hypothetical protein